MSAFLLDLLLAYYLAHKVETEKYVYFAKDLPAMQEVELHIFFIFSRFLLFFINVRVYRSCLFQKN